MITVRQICDAIEGFAPRRNAESWDNVGLLLGRRDARVNTVMTCLDADTNVARQAKEACAQMVVCHHPLIFTPMAQITDDTEVGRTVISLLESGIALYAAHTSLDAVPGGLCDDMAEKLGLDVLAELTCPVPPAEHVCGRILCADMAFSELIARVKSGYSLERVRAAGAEKQIKTVAVCSGGGRGLVDDVIAARVDCYIAGDLTHADARKLTAEGIGYIEITHFDSEISAAQIFADRLRESFGDKITVKTAEEKNPFQNF